MKVIFLGASGGIQTSQSSNVSFCVIHEGEALLVETSGSPVTEMKRQRIDPLCLTGVLITHSHIDHIYALPSLIHNLWLMKRTAPLAIYANQQTMVMVKDLLALFALESKKGMFPIIYQILDHEKELTTGLFCINSMTVNHSIPTSGISISSGQRKVVYLADSSPLPSYTEMMKEADLFIHEASGPASQEQALNLSGHSSGAQAGAAASSCKAARLVLCHLPEDARTVHVMYEEARKAFGGEVILAAEGVVYGDDA